MENTGTLGGGTAHAAGYRASPGPNEAALSVPLLERLRAIVLRQPEHPAVIGDDETVSYAQLWDQAERWAAIIRAAQPPSGPLALSQPTDSRYAAGLFACLMAGHACLPLDRANPAERDAAILRAARLDGLITCGSALSGLPSTSARVIDLGAKESRVATGARVLGPDEPALLVTISGSTGLPKLVVHSQRTMTHRALVRLRSGGVWPDDRYFHGPGTASTIADLAHMFAALFAGATLVRIDVGQIGVRRFLERVRDDGVTILRCGPSVMRTLLISRDVRPMLASLRVVRVTGEALLNTDIDSLRAVLPERREIMSSYTSTEMAGHGTYVVPRGRIIDPIRVPGAGPELVADTVILNEAGGACAPGEVAEIVMRHRHNAIGEWIDWDLVPGRLPTDPDVPDQRVYFSGDLGYRAPDGELVVVGRKDRQLKIAGRRVDPIEIEATLRSLPGVRDAAVLPMNASDAPVLFAFVAGALEPDAGSALREALRQLLPAAMVPARVSVLDQLPRLVNGKVDAVRLLGNQRAFDLNPPR